MVHEKTFTDKAQNFFWFQVGDIKISEIFYKIQKFLRTSWAPMITTNGVNFLMAGPLPSQPSLSHTLRDDCFSGMSGNLLKSFMRQVVIIKAHNILRSC